MLALSEDIFHQRGITLLYRTSNLIIQAGLYGKFFFLSIFYSHLYVFRDVCVTYPDFGVYNDVSYSILFPSGPV
jgi:hypothetical protein